MFFDPRQCIARVLLCGFAVALPCQAQVPTLPKHQDAKPQQTASPSVQRPPHRETRFSRYVASERKLIFSVPEDWKRSGTTLDFYGPGETTLRVVAEKVPSGFPTKAYLAATLASFRGLVGSSDPPVVRKVQFSGLEGRALGMEILNPQRGALYVATAFVIDDEQAINFVLVAPSSQRESLEPIFQLIVDSAIVAGTEFQLAEFDSLCPPFENSEPTPLLDLQLLVKTIDGTSETARQSAIEQLAEFGTHHPQCVADLMLDRRPLVRAAAIDALARSGNSELEDLIALGLGDPDAYVQVRAATALASGRESVDSLRDRFVDWQDVDEQNFVRIASLLKEADRIKIAREILLDETPSPSFVSTTKPPIEIMPPKPKPPSAVVAMVGGVPGGAPLSAPASTWGRWSGPMPASYDKVIAVALLADIPPQAFPIPYARILGQKDDFLTAHALGASLRRGEAIPPTILLPLLSSKSENVFTLAARHLGRSGSIADIKRIESARPAATRVAKNGGWRVPVGETLDLAIQAIQVRAQIGDASDASVRSLLLDKVSTAANPDRFWDEIASDIIDRRTAASETDPVRNTAWTARVTIDPLGANLYPKRVHVYTAAPDPSGSVDRIFECLQSVEFGAARDQANFALMLAGMREQLARQAGYSADDFSFERLGVAGHDPVSVAVWSADGAPEFGATGLRAAALVRVADRDRFEQSLALAQGDVDARYDVWVFAGAILSRGFALLPVVGPLAALSLLQPQEPDSPSAPPPRAATTRRTKQSKIAPPRARAVSYRSYTFVRDDACLGVPARVFERRTFDSTGGSTGEELFVVYIGDRAIVAEGRASMLDVLVRLRDAGPALGANADFETARRGDADLLYLSGSEGRSPGTPSFSERGSLKITNDWWRNSFHIEAAAVPGSESVEPIGARDARSPGSLLPRSTVLFGIARLNLPAVWTSWAAPLSTATAGFDPKAYFSADFERVVLPELGPECGAALLDLPRQPRPGRWPEGLVLFAEIRSDKLAQLHAAGRLFNPKANVAGAIRNGFLILAASDKTLAHFDETEKLSASPDFERIAADLPDRLVAFGGYNAEAALARFDLKTIPPETRTVVELISSMARAFNRHGFWVASSKDGAFDAELSVGIHHESGRAVADLAQRTKDFAITFATIDTSGIPLPLQSRLDHVQLRITSKAPDTLSNIREDVTSSGVSVDRETPDELVLTVRPRKPGTPASLQIPVADPALAVYLQPSREVQSDAESIKRTARDIAGADRDAWSVAQKLSAWTHQNLKWKRVDVADSVRTLATREADCLEFSELYVAMARSLGLPARIVNGVAYSGGAFGGHAWVEVWVGRWIEVDPTWGTDFVDATHIPTASSSLISYAALNLIGVEILEAPSAVSDERKDVVRLSQTIASELDNRDLTTLYEALDPVAIAREHLGSDASWSALDERGRRSLLGAFERMRLELRASFVGSGPATADQDDEHIRLVNVRETGPDRATAFLRREMPQDDVVLRFRFARRGGVWSLVEIENVDLSINVVAECMRPAIEQIAARREGRPDTHADYSPAYRAVALSDSSDAESLAVIEQALANDPTNPHLLHLKAVYLANVDRADEALDLLRRLSDAKTPYAPSVFLLAKSLVYDEGADVNEILPLLERYAALVPDDPRPHAWMAWQFAAHDDTARAEAEFRAVIALDPWSIASYANLAEFFAGNDRIREAVEAIDSANGKVESDVPPFDVLLSQLYDSDLTDASIKLATAHPDRIAPSLVANYYVAEAFLAEHRPDEAMPFVQRALAIDATDEDVLVALIGVYRQQKNWKKALATADDIVKLDDKNAGVHLERARALAQLGRADDAMSALKTALAQQSFYAFVIADDEELQPLANRPDFQALLPKDGETGDDNDNQ